MTKFIFGLLTASLFISHKTNLPDSDRAKTIRAAVWPRLQTELKRKGFNFNSPVYIRLFKDVSELEIWIKSGAQYRLFKTYEICTYTGGLGTKTRTGDQKSPEGFYIIKPTQLNPMSTYHLAINVGYPNKLERLKGYTGDEIMIHGYCASLGCYAMTDQRIEEIYTLVYKAFEAGQQKIDIDIFPFRMDNEHMKTYPASPFIAFWKTMKPGYDLFEKYHVPPIAIIKGKDYAFAR